MGVQGVWQQRRGGGRRGGGGGERERGGGGGGGGGGEGVWAGAARGRGHALEPLENF